MDGVTVLGHDGAKVRLTVEPERLVEVATALAQAGLRSLVSNPPTLEELFLREYGDELAPVADAESSATAADGAR
jgi:ABC-2 type transport system ATP-binding protein